jgi:DNA-binding LacI/PurR family transcriptional regulator
MKRPPQRKSVRKPAEPLRRRAGAPPGPNKLQMGDIARLAGVDISTVSRALNGSPLVKDETRLRIEELARSLNYSINVGARNLRLQQNRTVAVVVPYEASTRQHISDPFFVSMLGSLADSLTERGYDMLLSRVDAERLDLVGDLAASGRAIGVILIGQWHHHDQLNELAARHAPIVVWGAQLQQQLYCTVGSDNIGGGSLATDHLIGLGRRRIAFFGNVTLPEIGQRFEGYRRALTQHGIAIDPQLVRPTAFVDGSAERAVTELIKQKIPFDALFASSDLLALGAMTALREQGKSVPRDVAVVGYDDIELARYYHPTLTTIRQPVIKGGVTLVDALLAVVRGERPEPTMLPAELIVRNSSSDNNHE